MDNECLRMGRELTSRAMRERKARLLRLVREWGGSSTGELVGLMGCASRTVSRYLSELRAEGLVRRSRASVRGRIFLWEVVE